MRPELVKIGFLVVLVISAILRSRGPAFVSAPASPAWLFTTVAVAVAVVPVSSLAALAINGVCFGCIVCVDRFVRVSPAGIAACGVGTARCRPGKEGDLSEEDLSQMPWYWRLPALMGDPPEETLSSAESGVLVGEGGVIHIPGTGA